MSASVDTNILVRHLTGDPHEMASPASAHLATAPELPLADLIVVETVYVLQSFHEAPRPQVAAAVRSLLALSSVVVVDKPLLLRAVEVCEVHRLDLAEAYLVACAESSGVGRVASCDRSADRVATADRVDPGVG